MTSEAPALPNSAVSSIVYDAPRCLRFTREKLPDRRPDEIWARVIALGICGTDKHIQDGEFISAFPLIPGHEVVAEVDTERGTSIVAVDNLTGCGRCDFCISGRRQFCADLVARGVNAPGGAAEIMAIPRENCHSMGSAGVEAAVLAEPLSCVLHALDQARFGRGQSVLIFGTGAGGQILSQVVRARGARLTVVAGRNDQKLEVARRNGADLAFNTSHEQFEARLEAAAPGGFDLVIDATGAPAVIESLSRFACVGATGLFYGMAPEDSQVSIRPYEIFKRELHVVGSFAQGTTFPRAVEMLRRREMIPDGLITHRFELKDYEAALSVVGTDSCIKAILDVARPSGAVNA